MIVSSAGGGDPGRLVYKRGSRDQTSVTNRQSTDTHPPTNMQIKITKQISTIIKKQFSSFRNKKSASRIVLSEEEMDNLANEALESVLGCK